MLTRTLGALGSVVAGARLVGGRVAIVRRLALDRIAQLVELEHSPRFLYSRFNLGLRGLGQVDIGQHPVCDL